jgi:heme exporter protein D
MTEPCPEYRKRFEAAASGALSDESARELAAHIRSGCSACAGAAIEAGTLTSTLSRFVAMPGHEVGATLAERLAVACEPAPLPKKSALWIWTPWIAMAISFLMLATLLFERTYMRRVLRHQQRQLTLYREMAQALEAPSLGHLKLKSAHAEAGNSIATALWSRDRGLVLYSSHLPKLPAGKCYQLWVIRNKTEVLSAGLVDTDSSGAAMLYAPPSEMLEGVTGFALTDEPEGGSKVAQGKKLMVGTF